MPRINRAAFRAAVRSRRETLWIAGPDETAVTAIGASGTDLQSSLNTVSLALRPFTVTRTRGLIWLASDQEAASEVVHGAYGLAVVSAQAVAIGVTAIPTPIIDQSSDLWFLYQQVVSAVSANAPTGGEVGRVFEFDSKAMRKVEDGQDVVAVFENGSSAFGLTYFAAFRMLVKLH